jgi:hypothetical protein
LEFDADFLTLRRWDGSLLAAFSARGAKLEIVLQAAEDDRRGYPIYHGPYAHAESVRRMVRARMESSWERFLRTERRVLQARRNGQMAKALAWRLPGESHEELDRMASEDRRRAEKGLVELISEDGELSYKHIEELSPEDRIDRIRAELARIEWLLERQGRRNIVRRWAQHGHLARSSEA